MKSIKIKPFALNYGQSVINVSAIEIEIDETAQEVSPIRLDENAQPAFPDVDIESMLFPSFVESEKSKPKSRHKQYIVHIDGSGFYPLSRIRQAINTYSKKENANLITVNDIKSYLKLGNQKICHKATGHANCTDLEGLKWLNQIYQFAKIDL